MRLNDILKSLREEFVKGTYKCHNAVLKFLKIVTTVLNVKRK